MTALNNLALLYREWIEMNNQDKTEPALPDFQAFIHILRQLKVCLRDFLAPYKEALEVLPEQERLLLSQLSVTKLVEDIEKQRYLEEKEICALLEKREWWVRLDVYFTWTELKQSAGLAGESSAVDLDDFICRKFRDNNFELLDRMVEAWQKVPYLRERKDVLLDAFAAHKQGTYTLSVPALLPLLDGLAAEVYRSLEKLETCEQRKATQKRQRGKSPLSRLRDVAKAYHQSESKYTRDTFGEWNESLWSQMFERAIKQHVYEHYDFDSETAPSLLNRNAVLHGRSADYASEANSLRVFLLLDAYVEAFWNLAEQPLFHA